MSAVAFASGVESEDGCEELAQLGEGETMRDHGSH